MTRNYLIVYLCCGLWLMNSSVNYGDEGHLSVNYQRRNSHIHDSALTDGSYRLGYRDKTIPRYCLISLRNGKNFDVYSYSKLLRKQYRRVRLKGTIMYLLDQIPLHMDYDGQRRAERLSRIIVTLFGAVGLVWGYIIQQFSQTVYILGAGFVLAALVTIPPWPMYRRKTLSWQKPRPEGEGGEQQSALKQKKKK